MSLPYTLVEKSVLRKVDSPNTIGQVIVDTKSWMASLQESNNLPDFFYYAEVIDADTKLRYFVYSDEAVAYFGLVDNIVEADPTSAGESIVGSGVVSKSDVYSLDEVKTDKLYLGKPVYRKVIEGSFGELDVYAAEVPIPSFDNIVSLEALTSQIVGKITSHFGYESTYLEDYYRLDINSTNDAIRSKAFHSEWVNQPWTVTIEYTKTTDSVQEPETLNIIQSEMPSYSTEEVLTTERWIDGKPIYRKVVLWEDSDGMVEAERYFCDLVHPDLGDLVHLEHKFVNKLNDYEMIDTGYLTTWVGFYEGKPGFSAAMTHADYTKVQFIVKYTKTTDTAESPVAQLSIPRKEIIFGSWEYTYQGDYRSCDGIFDFGETETPEMFVDGKFIVPEDGIYSSEVALWIGNTDEVQQGYIKTSRRLVRDTFKRVDADAAVNLNTLHFLSKGEVIYYQALVSADSHFSNHNFNTLSLKIEKIG